MDVHHRFLGPLVHVRGGLAGPLDVVAHVFQPVDAIHQFRAFLLGVADHVMGLVYFPVQASKGVRKLLGHVGILLAELHGVLDAMLELVEAPFDFVDLHTVLLSEVDCRAGSGRPLNEGGLGQLLE